MTHLLSKRSEIVHNWEDFLIKYFNLCLGNPYHPEINPKGFINLGTAVNNISNDLIHPKITSNEIWNCDPSLLGYGLGHGTCRLRNALAALMTKMLHTHKPIDPNNLFCTVGVTSSIDVLAHCIADPGDVILVPTPVYGRIYTDLKQRSLVEIWPIPIITKDNQESNPVFSLEKVKHEYHEAISKNKNVRGIFLLNPSNPLGDVYSPSLMMEILEFCKEKKLHAIVDEVYALSVYSDTANFQSILTFPLLPDPDRTHVLYGISKDFAMAGLRIGAIHTTCIEIQRCLLQLSHFHQIPFPVANSVARFLEDLDWCNNFVTINKERLKSQYQKCRICIEEMGLPVRNSEAAFFLWVDLRDKCQITSYDEEMAFFNYLIDNFQLYIIPGKELFCEQPGWFRITFTIDYKHAEMGLNRLAAALQQYSPIQILSIDYGADLKIHQHEEKETLENLVGSVRNQIKESDWLVQNTAVKWEQENPDLIKLFVKNT